MSTTKTDQAAATFRRKKFGFYRPHTHHGFDNCDPNTGEILPSMTKQSEMDACDIHNILKQHSPAGLAQLIAENTARGQYVDLPDELDYQTALNTVLEGQTAFATLPAKTRERFHNNPAEFLEFMADPGNQDEAIALGLATDSRPLPSPVQRVEVVNPPEQAPPEPKRG
nr:MAG: internal scaffolding protein [Microvirus sp.]